MTRQITCTSFRNPSGNRGRIGRSMRRDVSVSFLTGAPSRLKYPPGIRPPAYARSRYSTVSGKKSCDSFALLAATHVASTIEPPYRTTTAPSACLATLPVSMAMRRPLISISTVWVMPKIVLAYRPESGERRVEGALCLPASGPPDSFRPRTDQLRVSPPSTADAELFDDDSIPLRRPGPEVFEETAPLTDEHEETATRMMILHVLLEMIREAVDALGQERDLDLGRPRVALVSAKLLDQTLLAFDGKRHRRPSNRHTPGSLGSHAGAGSKTSCFVSRYGSRVSRGRAEVKLRPSGPPGRSAGVSRPPLARGSDVERDLTPQILDAGELPLFSEASEKDQPDSLAVKIPREIEDMCLEGQRVDPESWPYT